MVKLGLHERVAPNQLVVCVHSEQAPQVKGRLSQSRNLTSDRDEETGIGNGLRYDSGLFDLIRAPRKDVKNLPSLPGSQPDSSSSVMKVWSPSTVTYSASK